MSKGTSYAPYIFIAISLILFGLITNISFGPFGAFLVIAMIVSPFLASIFSIRNFRSKGIGKWVSLILSVIVISTISFLGIIAAFLLKEF
ncbi:hypothetical protein [Bacillus sp. EAC]|uniref:hypothetical protein n=1 Tax=Bacillus sp. EAC TaxID=1978338 RepID=UPI000B4301C9|nr:hypothetical protein [Bacillus sp. EAC]